MTISDSISIKEGNSTFSTTSLLPLPQQQPLLQLLLLLSYYFYQAAQYAVQYFYILLLVYVVILLLVILSFDKLDSYLPPQHLHLSPTISTTTTPTTFTCFACDSTTTSATSSSSNHNYACFFDNYSSSPSISPHRHPHLWQVRLLPAPIALSIVIMNSEDRKKKSPWVKNSYPVNTSCLLIYLSSYPVSNSKHDTYSMTEHDEILV